LVEVDQPGLLRLKRFVPLFKGVQRPEAEYCSEAQRFFLDIAFRMALIDAAGGEDGTATFFCETPETALDISYVDNVVEMFTAFAKKQHNVLLTANLQSEGIAEKLLGKVAVSERKKRIVNLLSIGVLSSVQEKARSKFERVLNKMLGVTRR
jgi:hypothetical protein